MSGKIIGLRSVLPPCCCEVRFDEGSAELYAILWWESLEIRQREMSKMFTGRSVAKLMKEALAMMRRKEEKE